MFVLWLSYIRDTRMPLICNKRVYVVYICCMHVFTAHVHMVTYVCTCMQYVSNVDTLDMSCVWTLCYAMYHRVFIKQML